jgi:hypothetical protein
MSDKPSTPSDRVSFFNEAASRASEFRPGDVLSYLAERYHCREGTALVRDDGRAVDTFWGSLDSQAHVLTADELSTAERVFNVNNYDALDRYSRGSRLTWETYHPDDRGRITSQHGLQEALFIRKGATPDLATQIANARAAVERAEVEVRSAESSLKWRREDLAKLMGDTDV